MDVSTTNEQTNHNDYSDEFKKELDSRYEEYINGGELFTQEEVNERIEAILRASRKK